MNNYRTLARGAALALALTSGSAALVGCSGMNAGSNSVAASSSSLGDLSALVGKASLVISDGSGVVYDQSSPSLQLKAGQTYMVSVDAQNFPPGTSFSMQVTRIDQVGAQPVPVAVPGSFTPSAQGDYSFKLAATQSGIETGGKSYIAAVTCANPQTLSLVGLTVSASAAASNNLFNYRVNLPAGSPAGLQCALDPTGVAIQDTNFQDCGQAFNNFYSPYVDVRNVGVIVRDACNVTQKTSASVPLAHSTPSMPGNVFIQGNMTMATGDAAGDARVDGAQYLATNVNGVNPVQPNDGAGTFLIQSIVKYGMVSSVEHGIKITIAGLPQNIDMTTAHDVDASAASINGFGFTTDQAGDQRPPLTYALDSCSSESLHAKVFLAAGTPCAAGQTQALAYIPTLEVWGTYSCKVKSPTGSVVITGSFDGYHRLADNCVGGGGGGGGGIAPITL